MKKNYILTIMIFCLLLFSYVGSALADEAKQSSEEASKVTITDIRTENNKLIITGSGSFTYTLYKSADPYKASIEIPNVSIGKYNEKIQIDKGGISEINPHQLDVPRTVAKIDVTLQEPSILVPEYKDNILVLNIQEKTSVASNETDKAESKIEQETQPSVQLVVDEKSAEKPKTTFNGKATEINNVEILKTSDSLKVVITGNGTMIPNVFPINERIVVDIHDVVLKAALPAHAAAPLKSIRAGKHKDKLRLVLDLKEKTNFDVTAIGNTIEISLVAKEQSHHNASEVISKDNENATASLNGTVKNDVAKDQLGSGKYIGKKISLDFQDADVIPIFRLLGDISGYNIVVNPEVKGKITLKLINVPWDQALDVIMKTFSLSKIVDGNVIRVVPNSVLAKERKEIADANKAASEAGELKTKIFPVNFAQLDKLKDAIDKAKLQSARGSVSLDERGSAIIVNDIEANLNKIEALIKELDQEYMQARQVIIEARIVEVNSDYTKDLGVQWGLFSTDGQNTFGSSQTGTPGSVANRTDWLVNLPAGNTAGAIGFGFLNKNQTLALDLRLTAMEQINKGKIISSPKIMTMNNETANIKQGRELQLPSTDADGKPTLKSVTIVLSLDVTPRITPGGAVLLKTKVTKDELLGLIQAGSNVGADVSKNETSTMVLVNNGETLVIGGIYKKSQIDKSDGIPGLSKIPILGLLFKNEHDEVRDSELLIFITPRIVEPVNLK